MFILSKLEGGMILGEELDQGLCRNTFFSADLPSTIIHIFYLTRSKILMALEYTMDGKRLVDYDFYYKIKSPLA